MQVRFDENKLTFITMPTTTTTTTKTDTFSWTKTTRKICDENEDATKALHNVHGN